MKKGFEVVKGLCGVFRVFSGDFGGVRVTIFGGGDGGAWGQPRRHLFGWVNAVFDRVDQDRIGQVGPDRACAEWLLRHGAKVKLDKGDHDNWILHRKALPEDPHPALKLVEIDATESSVMHMGFGYLKGLKHVKKAVFHRCDYLEYGAVVQLGYLRSSLEHLQISSCPSVRDDGLLTLEQLKKLKTLRLYDLPEVREPQMILTVLKEALPSCQIDFEWKESPG